MSIFASSFSIDGDVEDEDGKAPTIYEASHILPTADSPRGGAIGAAHIPDHIDRGTEGEEGYIGPGLHDWLRVHITEDHRHQNRERYLGDAEILLDRDQVTRLRDYLTWWLDAEVRW